MATTPQITLTASLDSIVGAAAVAGYLRITLCGYGPQIPSVPGTCMLADAGVPKLVGPQEGSTALSVELFGNDVIAPENTFYEVAVLDQDRNVIQAGLYQFTGTEDVDLSDAVQVLPPFNLGFFISKMAYGRCTQVGLGGTTFNAPGRVIALAYNGVLMGSEFWSQSTDGTTINLIGWSTDPGDRIDAFYIAH